MAGLSTGEEGSVADLVRLAKLQPNVSTYYIQYL